MSKQPTAAVKDAPGEESAGRKPLVAKLKIPGIIVAIVVVEWLAAAMYLPGSSQPSQSPHTETAEEDAEATDEAADHDSSKHDSPAHGHKAEAKGGHGSAHDKPGKAVSHSDQEEVDLGEFTVTGYQPVSNSTMFVTFHLYGTIKRKHADEFASRLEENKHRIRENVIIIIRSAEVTDLTDAGLGLIKRRILETTNKTLGKPLLQGVMFSDFSFVEQ